MSSPGPAKVGGRYLLAVACDVEPVLVGQSRTAALDALTRDFKEISQLGFNTVMLRNVDEDLQLDLLNAAQSVGLLVVMADRRSHYYVLTGCLPSGVSAVREIPRHIPKAVAAHAGLGAFVVRPLQDPYAADRAEQLRNAMRERGLPFALVEENRPDDAPSLVRIDTASAGLEENASPIESWLGQYHEGLSAGHTAGVVFDRFRRLPGSGLGIAPVDNPAHGARRAAVRMLTDRAGLWGPRLLNLKTARINADAGVGHHVVVTAFIQGPRRYVMVFNRSATRYTRQDLVLPESIAGARVTRAVEVPPSRTGALARVINRSGSRIALPVALRPGDAVLFELF
ncbi:MAG: hypothetical protein ACE5HE_08705 [Phycisphaerae bacterium]